jgi:hypothetical protein
MRIGRLTLEQPNKASPTFCEMHILHPAKVTRQGFIS